MFSHFSLKIIPHGDRKNKYSRHELVKKPKFFVNFTDRIHKNMQLDYGALFYHPASHCNRRCQCNNLHGVCGPPAL